MNNLTNEKIINDISNLKISPKVSLIIKDKDLEISNLKLKLQSQAHLTYSNSIFTFVDSDILVAHCFIKGIYFYFHKSFLDFIFTRLGIGIKSKIWEKLSSFYLGEVFFMVLLIYITRKYLKSRKVFKKIQEELRINV